MALETNFNQSPYFDDYEDVAKGKDYHRILFKPGLAVQTRELTQIQSILQDQVRRMGDNTYKEGALVDGCAYQYDANVAFVRLRDRDPGGNTISVTAFANGIVQGLTTGVRAKIIAVATGNEVSAPDTNTLLVKYISGGTSGTNKTFALNETISYLPADGGSGQQANTLSADAFGFGSVFNVGEGLIYGKGHFVNVQPQTIILEKYNITPSYQVGFKIDESIVNSDSDNTLLDNARGSYNYTAPGADRLKLTATLVKKALGTANTEHFTPIFTVTEGLVAKIKQENIADSIEREIAIRTYEESGNYFVKQINVKIKEHLDNGENFGRYAAGGSIPGDKDKLAVGIEPGLAYVYGYRNEVRITEFIETDKALTTKEELGVTVTPNYGNYVECTSVAGIWDPTTYPVVSLRDTKADAVDSGVFGAIGAPGNEIGTANLRLVEYVSGTPGVASGRYRFYLFNVTMTASGKGFADVRSLYRNNATGPDSAADVVLNNAGIAVLSEPLFNRMVFRTGIRAVKQLRDSANTQNAVFKYRDKDTRSFALGGTATVSMGSPHAGGTEELDYGIGSLNDTQKATIHVVLTSAAESNNLPGTISFNTSSNTIAGISGTQFTTNLKPGDFIKVANTGSESSLLKVVSVAGASSMVVNPQPDITDGGSGSVFKVFPAGYIFDLTDVGTGGVERTATVSTTTSFVIDLKETFKTSGPTATIFFNAQRESAYPATKLVRKNRFVKINCSTNPGGTRGPWNLGFADVFNIRNVYVGSTYSVNNRKLTSDFQFNPNSNDNIYKHSRLEINRSSSLTLSTADRILVELDYFEHDRSGGIGYFSVDSYIIDPTESTSNSTAIATPEIPVYTSVPDYSYIFNSTSYDLRDSIDFRPRVVSTANDSITVGGASENPASSTTIDIDSDGSYVPVVNENFEADLLYYLPRTDLVVIGKDNKKSVVKGIPSDKPFPPVKPAETMILATLNIPPYPSLSLENSYRFGRSDQAVLVKPNFQRRYTMQDIQGLASRLDRLEYYTALSLLEKAASDLNIPDANGLDRFKNGIFVDAFFGHGNADLSDPAYNISVNKSLGEIRPRFEMQSIDLRFSSGSNVTRTGKHVRLNVSGATGTYVINDVVYVGSSFGTATATGTVRDVISLGGSAFRLFLHATTGTFNVSDSLKNNTRSGTSNISSVKNAATGALVTVPYQHVKYASQPYASKVENPVGELLFNWRGFLSLDPPIDHWKDTTTQPDVQFDVDLAKNWQFLEQSNFTIWGEWGSPSIETNIDPNREWLTSFNAVTNNGFGTTAIFQENTTTTTTFSRQGQRLNVNPYTRTQSSGDNGQDGTFVTDLQQLSYIRSRLVKFTANGLRPSTRVYAYFDDTPVNEYVTPTNSSFSPTGAAGSALITDANGNLYGTFLIPNNNSLKFRVGERLFRLVDIDDLVTGSGTETTSASATYQASGLAINERGITLSTREAELNLGAVVTDEISVTSRNSSICTEFTAINRDPIGQTFFIGGFEFNKTSDAGRSLFGDNADGIFVSCIDLYFRDKSSTAGLVLEIREVVNGFISQQAIPFGRSRVEAADVNVSSDSTAPTPFYFDQPVHVRGDKEYGFILFPDGNDPTYRIWIAEIGGVDINTGALIDEQPAVGMLFTSANDRTYVPRQNQDIKFNIWRASFDTSVTGTVNYTNEEDEYLKISQITGRYQTGEAITGEAVIAMTSNTSPIAVGDQIIFGANTGVVRKLVTTTGSPTIKADVKGTIASGASVNFVSGSGAYTGVVNTFTANGISGTVQYFDPTFGDLTANNSSGNYTANTNNFDGFVRGQTSNATSQVYSVRDFKYNLVVPKIAHVRPLDTDLTFKLKTTSNAYSISSSFVDAGLFRDNIFLDGEKLVAGRTRELTSTSGNKTFTLQGTMFTNVNRLSPYLDVGGTRAAVLVHNSINNDNSAEFGNYGNAKARYISKRVVLEDGQEAEDIKVVISAYKPPGTEVDVYARIQNEEDSEDFSDKHYTLLTQDTGTGVFSSIANEFDYREYEYGFPTTNATSLGAFNFTGNNNVVRYYNSANAYFDTYKAFQIKVVLRSSAGSQLVPKVKDLRAIALQI